MGFLDIFSRKRPQEDADFNREITEMKLNLQNLSEKMRVGGKNIETIYEAMDLMLKDIDKNAKDVANLAEFTNRMQMAHNSSANDGEIMAIKSRFDALESQMLENRRKMAEILKISKLSIQNYDEIKEIKKNIVYKEKERAVRELKAREDRTNSAGFSTKEKSVLNALLNSEIPLTYEEVAAEVNISPITVKGYINSIKKIHPDIIVENVKGRGRKAYSIKPDYRIKILSGKG